MGGGAVIGTAAVEGGKFSINKAKKLIDLHKHKKITCSTESNTLYKINKCGKSNEGLVFTVGDQFEF